MNFLKILICLFYNCNSYIIVKETYNFYNKITLAYINNIYINNTYWIRNILYNNIKNNLI